jgi:hypothetical protein
MATFRVAGRSFELERDDIETAVAGVRPDGFQVHFVVVGGRRYPPRQVVSCATGLRRTEFTADRARTLLRRLGFEVGRAVPTPELANGAHAAALEPYRGKWVALAGPLEVLVAADSPGEVLVWLAKNGRRAEHGVVRVPAWPHQTEPEREPS